MGKDTKHTHIVQRAYLKNFSFRLNPPSNLTYRKDNP